jgi:hypothetical protein
MAAGGAPSPPSGDDPQEFIRTLLRDLPELTAHVQAVHVRLLEEERKKKQLEIGFVGKLIGDVEPPIRVAFVALLIFVALLVLILVAVVVAMFTIGSGLELLDKIVTGVLSLLTGALGFIVGQRVQGRIPRDQPRQRPTTRRENRPTRAGPG